MFAWALLIASVTLDPRVIPKPGEHVLVGAGDIADCRGVAADATAKIVEEVLKHSANALAFTAGDNAYNDGTLEEFRRCYAPTWGRFIDRTAPVSGNHEWNTKGAAGHFAYFGKRAGTSTKPWRALKKGADGNWTVLLLDSNCDEVGGCAPGSPQARWLATELKETAPTETQAGKAKCTVAIWHHPRFSSGLHGNDARTEGLFEQLVAAKAELVIAGHDHHYERLDGPLPSFVVGTGGRQPYPVIGNAPGSTVRIGGVPGVIVVFLDADGWRAFFVDTQGAVRDQAAGKCR